MAKSTLSASRLTAAAHRDLEVFAKSLVETCVRNSELETLHAGITPSSAAGDFSDVKAVTPYGEIPCTGLRDGSSGLNSRSFPAIRERSRPRDR
jgi:hypothetical protein